MSSVVHPFLGLKGMGVVMGGIKFFIFCLALVCSSVGFSEVGYVEISQDRVIYVEYEIFDANKPTLILLPGINRALDGSDRAMELLKEKKINFVSLHFSGHPQSVIQAVELGKNPSFSGTTLESLKNEALLVINSLKIQKPLVVSLSFSGAVSMLFKKEELALVVDAVPLGRQDESNSFLQSYYDGLQSLNAWNPFALAFLENMKNQSYTTYWTQQVSGLRNKYPALKDSKFFGPAVRGMVAMSQTVEKFELEKTDFTKGPKRIFFLAEEEDTKRLDRQKKAIVAYEEQRGEKAGVEVFEKAGHILPSDAPEAYVAKLEEVLKKLPRAQRNLVPASRQSSQGLKCENLLGLE